MFSEDGKPMNGYAFESDSGIGFLFSEGAVFC